MSKKKYIGVLRERIELIQTSETTTDSGARTDSESVFKSCWADKQDISTTEEEDGKIYPLISKRWIIRYDKNLKGGVAEGMYVKWQDQYFNITACLDYIPRRYMVLNTIRVDRG